MRRWLLLLAGPLVWAAHFLALYIVASASFLTVQGTTLLARGIIAALTIGALAILAFAFVQARQAGTDDGLDSFRRSIAFTGILLGAIAVVWQTIPAATL